MKPEEARIFMESVFGVTSQYYSDNQPSSKRTSGVFDPEDKLFRLKVAIDKAYSKGELETLLKEYLSKFFREHAHKEEVLEPFQRFTDPKSRATKDELTTLLATIFDNGDMFRLLMELFPPMVQEMLILLVFDRNTLWFDDIPQMFPGVRLGGDKKRSYYSTEKPNRPAEYSLFPCNTGRVVTERYDRHREFGFYLPMEMRKALRRHLPVPEASQIQALENAPKAKNAYNAENTAPQAAKIIYTFVTDGRLEYNSNGKKPLKASLKKLSALSRLSEFYPAIYKDYDLLAVTLLASLAEGTYLYTSYPNDPLKEIGWTRALLSTFRGGLAANFSVMENLLGHVKRTSPGYSYSTQPEDIELDNTDAYMDLLATLPSGKWVSVENLYQVLKQEEERYYPIATDAAARFCYLAAKTDYGTEKIMLDDMDLYSHALVLPLLKSTIAICAALGMAEIVYDDPMTGDTKPLVKDSLGKDMYLATQFDSIRGVRLTALGEYMLGKTKNYQAATETETAQEGLIVLDEYRLFAKVIGENHIAELTLQDFMRPVSISDTNAVKLYRMDYASFLKGCRVAEDVVDQIELFRRNITAAPPPIWEQFFRDVQHKIEPLKEELQYRVFTLPPSQDLMKLLTQDEVLKKIIIKAEGYKILVPKHEIATLRKRLEKHGYLFSGK